MTESSSRPRILEGVEIDETARIQRCNSCGAEIWFGLTAAKKRNPFNVRRSDDGTPIRTAETHFSTCPQARSWTRRR